ncbi:hypothetical protein IMSAGC002_02542 [Lachnospiraceae bacterium]|nr:hypothetical protein IMSAGC002_02542 [Lachnospiraceae bacterium]
MRQKRTYRRSWAKQAAKRYMPALVTDSDCVTLFLAVNTLEYLKDNGGLESEDR